MRCRDCAHWLGLPGQDCGECLVISDILDVTELDQSGDDKPLLTDQTVIETPPEFGCIEFEEAVDKGSQE
jgi:hypothetical protein